MSTKHLFKTFSAASVAVLLSCSGAALAHDEERVDADRPNETGKLNDDKPHSDGIRAAISDTAITGKVKSKFAADTRLDGMDLDVSTANGVVLLKGSLPNIKAKRAATDLAENTEGVVEVNNEIVTPDGEIASGDGSSKRTHAKTSPTDKAERVASDSWITTKVKAALLADSLTKGTEISVKTTHRVVHLTGTVDSQKAIDRAREVARGIKHVKKVDTTGLKTGSG